MRFGLYRSLFLPPPIQAIWACPNGPRPYSGPADITGPRLDPRPLTPSRRCSKLQMTHRAAAAAWSCTRERARESGVGGVGFRVRRSLRKGLMRSVHRPPACTPGSICTCFSVCLSTCVHPSLCVSLFLVLVLWSVMYNMLMQTLQRKRTAHRRRDHVTRRERAVRSSTVFHAR